MLPLASPATPVAVNLNPHSSFLFEPHSQSLAFPTSCLFTCSFLLIVFFATSSSTLISSPNWTLSHESLSLMLLPFLPHSMTRSLTPSTLSPIRSTIMMCICCILVVSVKRRLSADALPPPTPHHLCVRSPCFFFCLRVMCRCLPHLCVWVYVCAKMYVSARTNESMKLTSFYAFHVSHFLSL